MKTKSLFVSAIVIASIALSSCGSGSMAADAKKLADLQCKAQALMAKASSGDLSIIEESTKLSAEAAELSKELEGKYTSDSDKKAFGEALLKEAGKCK